MCGRYASYRALDEIRRLFGTTNAVPNFAPNWNVAPSQPAPVVRLHPASGEPQLDLLRWGLVPHWVENPKQARQPINARSETAATVPMFRDALAKRRCLVPIDSFYEWQATTRGKIPHAIARADGAPMAAAGLWEGWRGADGTVIRSFTILTTEANKALKHLHERMPVILEPAAWQQWLATPDIALLRPSAAEFRVWRVSTAVNSVRNNGAELLEEQIEGGVLF
jgi:putative SOS response-associated peptidase YedK